ncbi:hypothetical protein ABT279_51625, partial [Amycolatopsis sp. NPDC000673]|uniref:hypothetical protein n=1 Tax=Amycolatopsis sp. NPDC000673 TaxID=3154267 RepID=UPI00331F7201
MKRAPDRRSAAVTGTGDNGAWRLFHSGPRCLRGRAGSGPARAREEEPMTATAEEIREEPAPAALSRRKIH